MKEKIQRKDLKLESREEENISTTYSKYDILWKGIKIEVLRTQRFSDVVGEQDDDIEVGENELDRDLTDEEEEEIKEFIWELR